MAGFNRHRLVFGLYLLVLIAIAVLVTDHFAIPAWPAFMAMIFFFVEQMDVKKVPNILVGGVFGIACILLATPVVGALAPLMGVEYATLAYVLVVVYAIVAFGEMAPLFFNNYAFMYLTVTGVAVRLPDPDPYLWMAVAGIGGGLLVAGVVAIVRIMTPRAQPQARS
jgi:hypothetical protein